MWINSLKLEINLSQKFLVGNLKQNCSVDNKKKTFSSQIKPGVAIVFV